MHEIHAYIKRLIEVREREDLEDSICGTVLHPQEQPSVCSADTLRCQKMVPFSVSKPHQPCRHYCGGAALHFSFSNFNLCAAMEEPRTPFRNVQKLFGFLHG